MIKFTNPGEINPLSFSVLGVNSKPDTENPIGAFGTGLKYAISIILRLGGDVTIKTSSDEYHFDSKLVEFRDSKVQQVYVNGQPLGFTTKLGEHWEPWMAYRELYANMVDENGVMDVEPADRGWEEWTCIEVSCKQLEHEFTNHWKYFLESRPVVANDYVELHEPVDKGRIYYKGVLVDESSVFPYNINAVAKVDLTEDRTLKSNWNIQWGIAKILEDSDNEDVLRKIMKVYSDNDFMASCYLPEKFSETAIKVAQELISEDPNSIQTRIHSKLQERKEVVYEEHPFQQHEQKMLDDAICKLVENNIVLSAPVVKTKTLNTRLVAFYSHRHKKIYLSDPAFQKGVRYLVTTLIEENAHANGYLDETREFQDYLLELIYDNLK